MAVATAAAVWPEGNENASGFCTSASKPAMPAFGRRRFDSRFTTCATRAATPADAPSRSARSFVSGLPTAARISPTKTHTCASPRWVTVRKSLMESGRCHRTTRRSTRSSHANSRRHAVMISFSSTREAPP
ncbi:MAG: hypothetical protein MUC96_16980 [Myxococcaceae bacterium]|nr:hypothetical protein [Myxococcaceae bacterium]